MIIKRFGDKCLLDEIRFQWLIASPKENIFLQKSGKTTFKVHASLKSLFPVGGSTNPFEKNMRMWKLDHFPKDRAKQNLSNDWSFTT